MTTGISKEMKTRILLSVFALGATLCIAQPAVEAAVFIVRSNDQAYNRLEHSPRNAPKRLVQVYYGKSSGNSGNILNL